MNTEKDLLQKIYHFAHRLPNDLGDEIYKAINQSAATPTDVEQIKPLVLNREKRCHICSSWTSLNGCAHYGPQDYDQNKPIIDAITKAVHGDNGNIVETSDFYAGVNAALLVLRQNNLIQAGQSAVQDATPQEVPTDEEIVKLAKEYSEGWGDNDDTTAYFFGYKTAYKAALSAAQEENKRLREKIDKYEHPF